MTEIWKDIEGYEGLYQVSNLGRVKSLHFNKERILKPTTKDNGYLQVSLFKDRVEWKITIHRLVAQAFISNTNNLPQVNHKDEDKTNNTVYINSDGSVDYEKSNLEWCAVEYNINYGNRNKKNADTRGYKVEQYDLEMNLINIFPSTRAAAKAMGGSNTTIIKYCNCNEPKYGYLWRYAA